MGKRTCSIEGCDRPHAARGWCDLHYRRWQRAGTPHVSAETTADRFDRKTRWEGDCLIWQGSDNGTGHAQFKVDGKRVYVHRYAWERAHGPIPDGMVVDHRCFNKLCCNVEHLRLATMAQNTWSRNGAQPRKKHTSVRNVYPSKYGFRVSVGKDRMMHHFGTYSTIEEASNVAVVARRKLFGEFAGKG